MKNTSMNRQSLVSIFRLMLLVYGVLGILLTSLLLVGCGGDEEEDTPEASVGANPLVDKEEEVPPRVQEQAEPPLNDLGACTVGLTLKAGESCTYPGTNAEFSVLNDGRGNFLFFTSGTGINARNTTINGILYNFVASKQADGTWLIEAVGGNPVNNPEAPCEIPPLNEDWKGEPVLFGLGGQGKGAILLSDGKFFAFIWSDPADPPPINVYGGPVQTATKALVQFVGFDVINRAGVQIPDGEITEFEVSDAFIGTVELEDNRRTLTMNLPEQKGETIKGGHVLDTWLEASGPCTLDINKVPPALSAELTEYAKDLLDIMEAVGGNPVIDNPDARCQISPLDKDFGGKAVLFIDDDMACVLLSDGNFASFACKADGKVIIVGGPVETPTKALVKFAGIDLLNRAGVKIPDGELTEFEVSGTFVGVMELKDNRTAFTVSVPRQDGDTIKGGHRLVGLHNISQGICIQDIDKERPAVTAELTKYAKDLLDIMRRNPK